LEDNAAKYTPQGGKISLSTERIGDEVSIRVKDNGLGIASDMLPRIFDMFVQANSSRNCSQGGLGIGLTLVKSLVKMHGGSVEATSDGLGKGSEFTVRLPILQASVVIPEEANDLPDEARSFPFNRILIVDDVPPAALLVAIMLRSKGQQVRTAESGPEALAMIEQEKPSLILSDISMPGMADGSSKSKTVCGPSPTTHRDSLSLVSFANRVVPKEFNRLRRGVEIWCKVCGLHLHRDSAVEEDR
jgi:hypothetical protein